MLKQLIFTCTSGRSGTGYLAALFNAWHEPAPYFAVEAFDLKNYSLTANWLMDYFYETLDPDPIYKWFVKYKIPTIISTVPQDGIYMETSNQWTKGVLPIIIKMFPGIVKIIRLRRDREKTIQSFIRVKAVSPQPGWIPKGVYDYCLIKKTEEEWNNMTDYEKCAWHLDEVEQEWLQRVKPLLEENQYIEIDLKDIIEYTSILDQISTFIGKSFNLNILGKVINKK